MMGPKMVTNIDFVLRYGRLIDDNRDQLGFVP